MNELESEIIQAAIRFLVDLTAKIMSSAFLTLDQKQELLKQLSASLALEAEKVKNAP